MEEFTGKDQMEDAMMDDIFKMFFGGSNAPMVFIQWVVDFLE